MGDLFHKDVPIGYIKRVFTVMKENPQHIFQVLTMRTDILNYYDSEGWLEWTHNIWMGVTVENTSVLKRINLLRTTGARVKFLSCEPLLDAIPNMDLKNIDWIIVGGESGSAPCPMKEEWVMDIKEQCQKTNVAFYFKQWGGTNKKEAGSILNGQLYKEVPHVELAF